MRITFALLGLLLCANASAGPIDSSASGIYVGSNRTCRVIFSANATHTSVDMLCIRFDGSLTSVLPVIYTFGAPCAISRSFQTTTPASGEYISLRDYTGSSLIVVLGSDQTQVTNGIGTVEAWPRIVPLPSPGPYACDGAIARPAVDPHAMARFCRQYPDAPVCGN